MVPWVGSAAESRKVDELPWPVRHTTPRACNPASGLDNGFLPDIAAWRVFPSCRYNNDARVTQLLAIEAATVRNFLLPHTSYIQPDCLGPLYPGISNPTPIREIPPLLRLSYGCREHANHCKRRKGPVPHQAVETWLNVCSTPARLPKGRKPTDTASALVVILMHSLHHLSNAHVVIKCCARLRKERFGGIRVVQKRNDANRPPGIVLITKFARPNILSVFPPRPLPKCMQSFS